MQLPLIFIQQMLKHYNMFFKIFYIITAIGA